MPGQCVDLGQHKEFMIHSAAGSPMHTLIKGMGLQWAPELDRWFTPSELLTMMGFPISAEAVAVTGEMCQFSRHATKPYPGRTRASCVSAVGNAMHMNAIGAVIMATLWCNAKVVDISCGLAAAPHASNLSRALAQARGLKRARSHP